MPDYSQIINTLNRKLISRLNQIRLVPNEKDPAQTVEELVSGGSGGFGFGFHYGGEKYPGSRDRASSLDVEDAEAMDSEYKTHNNHSIKKDHPIGGRDVGSDGEYEDETDEDEEIGGDNPIKVDLSNVKEQDEDPASPPESKTATEDPAFTKEPDIGGDPGMDDMGIGDISDPGMGDPLAGIPGMEEPANSNELGRTYEMKKIYARLISMNEYLSDERSPRIMKTKISIAKAIDLFAVIGANPESYKDKIDDIIVSYYKFLEVAYQKVRAFYKAEAKRVGGSSFNNNEEQKDDKGVEVTI